MSNYPNEENSYINEFVDRHSSHTTSLNVNTHRIIIDEDRARLLLNTEVKELKNVIENRERWKIPAGIFFSLISVFPTSEFNDWIIPADLWKFLFCLGIIVSLVISVIFILKAVSTKNRSEDEIINDIIHKFTFERRSSPTSTSQEST